MSIERRPKTAAELMAELEADETWVADSEARGERHREQVEANRRDAARVLAEINREVGLDVSALSDLAGIMDRDIVAILVRLLHEVDNVDVKKEMIRLLGTGGRPEAARPLIEEFYASEPGPEGDALRWSIASALCEVADPSIGQDLIRLSRDPASGQARQMLTLALGSVGSTDAIPVLVDLLQERDVAGHAVIALRALGAVEARSDIERLEGDSRAWVRREVRRAMAELSPD